MSSVQSDTTLKARLEALQCHFTWVTEPEKHKLYSIRDTLEDIGTEGGHSWLGHIYNLQGFIHYKLGFIHYKLGCIEQARSFFSRAAEAFCQMRNSDEGPWLVVNYGNKAWLHYHQGERAESQACLSKVHELMNEYPSPSRDELHPEIYAEKGWTLMKFGPDNRLRAEDCLQRAIKMQPDMVEWQTSHVMALNKKNKNKKNLGDDIMEKMEIAMHQDPENLYLAALYLEACAIKGQRVEDEARELATKVLRNPVSSYSGIEPLLKVYRNYISTDEAINLVEEAIREHPENRYLKRRAAVCYKIRIFKSDSPPMNSTIDRAITLHRQVISLYPDTSLQKKITLANICGQNHNQAEADQIYKKLLQSVSDLDPTGAQMLYNYYAKHLHFVHKRRDDSIRYHMKAAKIPAQCGFRGSSISTLRKIKEKGRSRMCREIGDFLATLQL